MVYLLDTAKDAFDIILQVGAGTGLLYLVRWFWWRVNAWCEVAAMVSSFLISMGLLVMARAGSPVSTHVGLMVTVALTTVCWVATAYLAPATDRDVLVNFYRRVYPGGPGWTAIREAAGMPEGGTGKGDRFPLALLGWALGCMTIWSALFTVGNFLYGRYAVATGLLVVFLIAGTAVARIVSALWPETPEAERA
jgi:hypothetical protein